MRGKFVTSVNLFSNLALLNSDRLVSINLKMLKWRIRLMEYGLSTPIAWDDRNKKLKLSDSLRLFGSVFWSLVIATYTVLELSLLIPKIKQIGTSKNALYLIIDILHSGINQICTIMSFLVLLKRETLVNWFNQLLDLDKLLRSMHLNFYNL